MNRVLMVSYLFPPLGGSGVQRSAKFARYLPRNGWEPFVIAARGRYLRRALGHDSTLLEGLDGSRIWRLGEWDIVPALETLADGLLGPGSSRGNDWEVRQLARLRDAAVDLPQKLLRWRQFTPWVLNAAILGVGLVRRYGIRVLYSSHPPVYSHVAASLIARFTGLPWVADYRDPYTTRVGWTSGPGWYARYLRRLEAGFARRASRVVAVGEIQAADLREAFSEEPAGKFLTIRNGYDPDDFGVPPLRRSKDLTIVHAGIFYWGWRDPTAFLDAVRHWLEPDGIVPGLGRRLRIEFLGLEDSRLAECVRRMGLTSVVHVRGYVEHSRAVSTLLGSDLILVMNGPGSDPHADRTIPGKLYEALGSLRPVLLLSGRNSEAAGICRGVDDCFLADVNDRDGILAALKGWASRRQQGALRGRSAASLEKFTRQEQARALAGVFKEVVCEGRHG